MTNPHNMALLPFADPASCAAALEESKRLTGVREAAVLQRSEEGLLDVGDTFVRGAGVATVGSSVVGGLIGLLGGPVGVFIGSAVGAALGNAAEQGRAAAGGAGLIVLGPRVEDGTALLVLEIVEETQEPLDAFAAAHGTAVERLPAAEFAAQVRAAEAAAEKSTDS